MFSVVWRFRVTNENREAFETAYGPEGPWAQLFGESPDYDGTDLLRGEDGVYLTIDRWTDARAYDAFITLHRADYARIDAECEELTEEETLIGRFEALA